MSLARPSHLVHRQVSGRAFGEEAQLLRVTGQRNDYWEYQESTNQVDIMCATAPPTAGDPRVRVLMEGGVQLEAMRMFWTAENLEPVQEDGGAGDIVIYAGERWRIRSTQRWGGFSESIGVRQEGQPASTPGP